MSDEMDIQLKLSNLEVEVFYTKWAERLQNSADAVEFGEDLMNVIRSIGDSVVSLMRFTLLKDDDAE